MAFYTLVAGTLLLYLLFASASPRQTEDRGYMENVAPLGKCNQSSFHSNEQIRPGNNCTAAMNGDVSTNYTSGNCIHTHPNDTRPFWRVELDKVYNIHRITVYGRTDGFHNLDRMRNVTVDIDNTPVFTFPNRTPSTATDITEMMPREGRTVTFYKQNGENNLIICEVQIWVCKKDRYGENCTESCGRCAGGSRCNSTSGHCSSGCEEGWQGPLCQVCEKDRYGENCRESCGRCAGGSRCNSTSGHCSRGCEEGWQEPLCQEGSAGLPQEVVIGLLLLLLLALVIVAIVVIVVRTRRTGAWPRRGKERPRPPSPGTMALEDRQGNNSSSPQDGSLASLALTAAPTPGQPPHLYSNTPTPGQPPHLYSNTPTPGQQPSKPATADPAIAGDPVDRNAGGKSTSKLPQEKKSLPAKRTVGDSRKHSDGNQHGFRKNKKKSKKKKKEEEEEEEEEDEDVYSQVYTEVTKVMTLLDSFSTQMLHNLACPDHLSQQFKEFPRGMQHPCEVSQEPANRGKNRFKNIGAYDKNRVVLQRPNVNTGSTDYINASFIKGIRSDKDFIAAQGPLAHTVDDLWWMVWQEQVTQVVMVTNLVEHGKVKCQEYWPQQGETVAYGHVTVTSERVKEKTDFLIRYFSVTVKGSGVRRTVVQYHYLAWPDHGVPVASSLVRFWRYVTADVTVAARAPPLVHCSAGVGRTGTYIALDIASERKLRGLDVNVRSLVAELREQRCLMVQTEAQYKFLHEVLLEEHLSRGALLTLEQLDTRFTAPVEPHRPSATIDRQLQILRQLNTWTKRDSSAAQLEENKGKNRDTRILPDVNHMIYLNPSSTDGNQYINAVSVPSLAVRKGFLLTQLPLPHTVADLWRLVDSQEVRVIVSLGGSSAGTSTVTGVARYWPQAMNQKVQTQSHTVWLDKLSVVRDTIFMYDLRVDGQKTQWSTKLLHYPAWATDLPSSTADLFELVSLLKMEVMKAASPVLVQCLDGASQSGLFAVLCDVIRRMEEDEVVDVFSPVRHLHQVRPQGVSTETQYRYCFHVAQEFRENQKVYANT